MRLKIRDKEFELKPLTWNDIIEIEDAGVDSKNIKAKDGRTLLHILIKKIDDSITPEWIGESSIVEMTSIMEKLAIFLAPEKK